MGKAGIERGPPHVKMLSFPRAALIIDSDVLANLMVN